LSLKKGGLFDYKGVFWNLTELPLALWGDHQRSNAALALAALEVARKEFPVSEAAVREGLDMVFWPGRFEVLLHRPIVILDGAHNGESVKVLISGIRDFQGTKKVKLLFSTMKDKDWSLMLKDLSAVASEVVLTRIPMERGMDPMRLRDAVPQGMPMVIIENPIEALRYLIRSASVDQTILVTGSLYLLGEVRPFLTEMGLRDSSQRQLSMVNL